VQVEKDQAIASAMPPKTGILERLCSLLKKRHCRPKAPSAAEAEIDFVAHTARPEAAPFPSKIKSEIFQQTVQPLGLPGTAQRLKPAYSIAPGGMPEGMP